MRTVFFAFLTLLFLAPVPYGLVQPLPQAVAVTAIWVLVAWTAVVRWRAGADAGFRLVRWEALVFALLVAWICFQMLPIGGGLAHPLWAELPAWIGRDSSGSISLSPSLTFEALMRLLAYGALFWMVLQFGQDRDRAAKILVVVVASGWLNALYGIINNALGNHYVLLAERYAYRDDVTGTFINRNSAAAFFGLCLLPAVAYLANAILSRSGRDRERSRTERLGSLERKLERAVLGLAILAVPVAALLMTHSRAGTLSVLAAVLLTFAIVMLTTAKGGTGGLLKIAGLGVVVVLLVVFSSQGLLTRLNDSGLSLEQRGDVYRTTWRAIQDSPLGGFGYGTFEKAFFLYMPASFIELFDRAHNDWLEGLFGLGWIGALLLNGLLASFAVRSVSGAFTRHRSRIFCTVGVAASLQLAIHSTVDFSLQIPAIAIYFTVLLALGVAQSVRPPHGTS